MDIKTNIYILRLEENKWYVGKTENPEKRYAEHCNGGGSSWTRRYKPIELFKRIEGASPFEEDKYTKEYMALYGIDNVRGGAYVSMELTMKQRESLQKELWSTTGCCLRCGEKGHFVAKCPIGALIPKAGCDMCKLPFKDKEELSAHRLHCMVKTPFCLRCGRTGHSIAQCKARTHLDGSTL